MTKEDYMRLPKERLAELLVERDWENKRFILNIPFAQCADPNGVCMNPFRDCVNCPRPQGGAGTWVSTSNKVEEQQ